MTPLGTEGLRVLFTLDLDFVNLVCVCSLRLEKQLLFNKELKRCCCPVILAAPCTLMVTLVHGRTHGRARVVWRFPHLIASFPRACGRFMVTFFTFFWQLFLCVFTCNAQIWKPDMLGVMIFSGRPPAPDWQVNSYVQLKHYKCLSREHEKGSTMSGFHKQ